MNKSEITKNYNIDKIVTAKELASLSRIYKDNLETIIVMMRRKERNTQPPTWFKEFEQKQVQFNKTILKKLSKYDKLFKQHGWI